MATTPYLEDRDGGYYVVGTRVGLDVIVREFQSGQSPEAILQQYPSLGSLAKVYGVITFILERPEAVGAYLHDQNRVWDEIKQKHPLPQDLLERFYRARELARNL